MGAFLLTTPAFAGVSGGIDLASEYLWRGASQSTGDDPVVQFNLEADWNGFYGGTWGSQVDFGDGKFLEYDFYGGYATSYKDLTIDVGMIQYNYNKFIDESVEEWYAILGYKYVSVSYYKDMAVHFIDHEAFFLYKEKYIEYLGRLLEFPVTKEGIDNFITVDANHKYVFPCKKHWLDDEIRKGREPFTQRPEE